MTVTLHNNIFFFFDTLNRINFSTLQTSLIHDIKCVATITCCITHGIANLIRASI